MKMNKKLAVLMMGILTVGSLFTGCGKTVQTLEEKPVVNEADQNAPAQEEGLQENAETSEEGQSYGDVDPTPAQEMFYVATEGIEMPANMPMAEEMFQDTYGIDPTVLSSYYVAVPMMNVHATEVAVFELKDEKDADKVKEGIEKRKADLEAQWQSYLPEQYELVQNAQVAEKGNKVLFVISSDADKIVANFNAAE